MLDRRVVFVSKFSLRRWFDMAKYNVKGDLEVTKKPNNVVGWIIFVIFVLFVLGALCGK